ncbi:hypothetical protein FLX56_27045 [Synechococcus moorigangaii CMS01]|nr:hypothetical protein [Synechococcus moorigangaii CMS01]
MLVRGRGLVIRCTKDGSYVFTRENTVFVPFQELIKKLESSGSLLVTRQHFGISSQAIRALLAQVGYDFEAMIAEQYSHGGAGIGTLKQRHGLGHAKLHDILTRHGAIIRNGNLKEQLSSESCRKVLAQHNGNRSAEARALGVDRGTLSKRIDACKMPDKSHT